MPVRPPVPAAARGPVRLELDWDALEIAVERNSPDTDSYLDLTSGRVITITTGDPEAALNRQQVSENIRNFLRVEPASSREQYRWMEKFVGSVTDEALRERLIISIDGKGAFRRFKDVLLAYPAERERWFSYRAELLHWHIQQWLGSHDGSGSMSGPRHIQANAGSSLACIKFEYGIWPVSAASCQSRAQARQRKNWVESSFDVEDSRRRVR